jgi:hypothetical protein
MLNKSHVVEVETSIASSLATSSHGRVRSRGGGGKVSIDERKAQMRAYSKMRRSSQDVEQRRLNDSIKKRAKRANDPAYRQNERLRDAERRRQLKIASKAATAAAAVASVSIQKSKLDNSDDSDNDNDSFDDVDVDVEYYVNEIDEKEDEDAISNMDNVDDDEEVAGGGIKAEQQDKSNVDDVDGKRLAECKRKMKQRNDMITLICQYEEAVAQGPNYVCICCAGMFFRRGVTLFKPAAMIRNEALLESIFRVELESADTQYWICISCASCARNNKVPLLALSNELAFPTIVPQLLRLNDIEERLCSPRLPFLLIQQVGWDKQKSKHFVNILIRMSSIAF